MISPDVLGVLKYLNEKQLLCNLHLVIFTNASQINKEYFKYLNKARSVHITLSVDGIDEVQDYIRFGPSGIDRVERFVEYAVQFQNISFDVNVAVMVYNIFSLDRIADWWANLRSKYGEQLRPLCYETVLEYPDYLSVTVLAKKERNLLANKYKRMNNADYSGVIHLLKRDYAGKEVRDRFIRFTNLMDSYRGTDVLSSIPELQSIYASGVNDVTNDNC